MLTVILSAVAGMVFMALMVALVVAAWPKRSRFLAPDWVCRLRGEAPWAKPAYGTMVEGSPAGHEYIPYSRHDLAECGMTCPLCHTQAAEQGDFSGIRRAKIDGHINEVLKCPGIISEDGKKPRKCLAWLCASPDTEHGDHLGDDGEVVAFGDIPENMYLFKRVSAAQVLKDRWGVDVGGTLEKPEIGEEKRPAVGGESGECIQGAPLELMSAIAMGPVGETTSKAYLQGAPNFSTRDTEKHAIIKDKP